MDYPLCLAVGDCACVFSSKYLRYLPRYVGGVPILGIIVRIYNRYKIYDRRSIYS